MLDRRRACLDRGRFNWRGRGPGEIVPLKVFTFWEDWGSTFLASPVQLAGQLHGRPLLYFFSRDI
jgi:hypothetical protein